MPVANAAAATVPPPHPQLRTFCIANLLLARRMTLDLLPSVNSLAHQLGLPGLLIHLGFFARFLESHRLDACQLHLRRVFATHQRL